MFRFVCLSLVISFAQVALSAPEPLQAALKKSNRFIEQGLFVGGQHQRDLALTDLRRQFSKPVGLERIVLEMSVVQGKPTGRAGFFHVQKKSDSRIQIDIAGLAGANRPLDDLGALLAKSPFVSKAQFVIDPEDRSTSITLDLKRSDLVLEAYELPGPNYGRLVLDLKEKR